MARLLAFPGSSSAVQREIATDFMKRTTLRLCRISHSTADLAANIMLESSQDKGDGKSNKKLVLSELQLIAIFIILLYMVCTFLVIYI